MPEDSTPLSEQVSDAVAAVSCLAAGQLCSLARLCSERDASGLTAGRLKRELFVSTTEATHLARNLDSMLAGGSLTARDVQVVAETLATVYGKTRQNNLVEVVCTAPERYGLPVRTTYATATQMIQDASAEIIVVGYVFTEGASVLVELLAAAQTDRRVQVTIVGNRMRDQMSRLKEMWPAAVPLPPVFSREPLADDPMAALHAKLLLCDRSEALVTSANFSHHGLHANIEIGLHVRSPVVERLCEFVLALISCGEVNSVASVN